MSLNPAWASKGDPVSIKEEGKKGGKEEKKDQSSNINLTCDLLLYGLKIALYFSA